METRTKAARRDHTAAAAALALLAANLCVTPVAAAAAPMTQEYFCMAHITQPPRVLYLTGIFPAAAEKRDVISAWKLHLESERIDAGPAVSCDGSVDTKSVRALQDVSRASAANLNAKVVDVDWKFAGQVPISQPNTLYGYCQSGTSVAGVTYFSDVFGLELHDSMRRPAAAPFLEHLRTKYGDPPGLTVGPGPGPRSEGCTMIGNIADAERDKKVVQDKLRSAQRKIVETGWRFGEAPTPAGTP